MEKMYNDYKDIAEFRLIYIREAHAADSARPTRESTRLGIKEHTDYDARCTTAQLLADNKSLTMPMLIDSMDNKTDLAYSAKPDRVFLVRTDGRLGVASGKGPRGFKPGLDEVKKWLTEFKKTGNEPSLPGDKKKAQAESSASSNGK